MQDLRLTGEEMLAWNDRTAQGWRQMVEAHPEMLDIACDIFGVKTVGQALHHIVAVEIRLAQRLAGLFETPFEDVPWGTADQIFGAQEVAMQGFRAEIAKGGDWDSKFEFQTLFWGRVRASRKTVFVHAMMHSIRHYAQLATLVRQHGFKPDWPMDYMLMGIERLD